MKSVSEWLSTPESVFTLVGAAGTGKSTLLTTIPQANTHFCAPTGKAADVLRNKGIPATTIHRLIYDVTPSGFKLKESLPCKYIIIDEGSMISSDVWRDLLAFGKKYLVVGDPHQLPPVGEDPNLFVDPSFLLTKIHRNAEDSPVIAYSQKLRETLFIPNQPLTDVRDSGSVHAIPSITALDYALERHSLDTLMVITAKNTTRLTINKHLRDLRGFKEKPFGVGELLVCRRNNYKHNVFNGQLFYVETVSVVSSALALCNLRSYDDDTIIDSIPISIPHFNTPKKPSYKDTRNICLFDFGYCLTAHYAQGSEFDNVLVIEPPALGMMFSSQTSRWRYTAATRAKNNLYYGSPYIK